MLLEIVSSGEPRRTIVRDVATGEEVNGVVAIDIHLGMDGSYANIVITHPIIKYIGPVHADEDYITIEKKYDDS